MTSILGSVKVCPSYMRAAFRNLARRVSDHFGDEPEYEVGRKIFRYDIWRKRTKRSSYGILGSIFHALSHPLSSFEPGVE